MTRRRWFGFAALCVLSGSGWALDEVAPGLLRGLVRMAVHDGLLAIAFGAFSFRDRGRVKRGAKFWVALALTAVAMFAVPQILFAAAGGHVAGTTVLLVFMLVPAVVVFGVAQQGAAFGGRESPLRFLAPALAGLLGAVLMLPFDWPPSSVGRGWLVAIVLSAVLAGLAAVRLYRLLDGVGVLRGAAVMFGASSLAAVAFCWVDWSGNPGWSGRIAMGEVVRLVVAEAPILLLTVWLLREMQPIRFSARVLMIPLVMIVEGYVIERPPVDWTTGLGVVLLAGGAAGLLRAESA
jgi:drug/metabolite transporter (DMT)-like permease